MATITPTHDGKGGGVVAVTWTPLANGDSGKAAGLSANPDKSVQVTGTFGTGGSVNLEGSNDGTNWEILNDALGNAITLTAAGLVSVLENPLYVRPNVTAGDGTTSLTVTVVGRDNK